MVDRRMQVVIGVISHSSVQNWALLPNRYSVQGFHWLLAGIKNIVLPAALCAAYVELYPLPRVWNIATTLATV